jgi:hypothetical protein
VGGAIIDDAEDPASVAVRRLRHDLIQVPGEGQVRGKSGFPCCRRSTEPRFGFATSGSASRPNTPPRDPPCRTTSQTILLTDEIEPLAGKYRTRRGHIHTVRVHEGRPQANFAGPAWIDLVPSTRDHFRRGGGFLRAGRFRVRRGLFTFTSEAKSGWRKESPSPEESASGPLR